MNNFKKIGLTALAGSLVAISAQAGEMSVSGSFNATYSSESGSGSQGKGLGTDKDFSVSGAGELDNGYTFSGYTLLKDDMAVSSSALTLTMGSMGSVSIASGSGGNSTKYDVQTPTAYEEIDDGGNTSLSANFVGSWADNNSLIYASPTLDMGGVAATIHVEFSPEATGTSPNDGTVVDSIAYGNGKSLGVTLAGSGVTFGAYGATREANDKTVGVKDSLELVSYLNYAVGNVALGVSMSHFDIGAQHPLTQTTTAELATAAKVVGTAKGIFESTTYSIAYNINENVSVSYAKATDTYDAQASKNTNNAAVTVADVDSDSESFQVAYSMGAMSIKAYQTKSDNNTYMTGASATSQTTSEIALGLAF